MAGDGVWIVTGASRGIGAAIARLAVDAGHNVALIARGESVMELAQSFGESAAGFQCDVADPASVSETVDAIVARFGRVEVLVNNAGVTEDNLLMRMKPSQWQRTLNTNLASVFSLTKLCLKGMTRARYGRIINLSSVVGATGNAGQTNYAASKAGLIGFTKSLALEIASRGITVNAVAPGFIDTDMTLALGEDQRAKLLESIPLARLGRADDISKAVAFLVSDDASYITGQVLHVNGGMHMSS